MSAAGSSLWCGPPPAESTHPLNDYVSLDPSLFLAHQDFTFFGTAYHQQRNPEDVVIHEENLSTLEEAIRKGLTGLEAQVLACYLHGLSYAEIAEEVQRSTKSVDNAVQRFDARLHSIYPAANTAKADRIFLS